GNPRGFPALYSLALDGTPPRRVATRYFGSTVGIGRDAIYFDQVEQRRNVGFYTDLYELSRADGSVRQLTSDARLQDPDLSPDGATLVCTQNRSGQRDLVLALLKAGAADAPPVASAFSPTVSSAAVASGISRTLIRLVSEPDVYFDTPRWSPDGRTIAVTRHRLGAMPELVVVDVAARSIRVVAAAPDTRFAMPAWRPDGAALVVAGPGGDQTFNPFEGGLDGATNRP